MRVVGTVGDGYKYLSPCSSLKCTSAIIMTCRPKPILMSGVRSLDLQTSHLGLGSASDANVLVLGGEGLDLIPGFNVCQCQNKKCSKTGPKQPCSGPKLNNSNIKYKLNSTRI